MQWNRTLTLAATVFSVTLAPMAVASAANASPAYSVSAEHCGGGIAIRSFPTRAAALHARNKAVHQQRQHKHSLRTVQLRHGSKLIASYTRPC